MSFGTNVHARLETIWELMLDRIEHREVRVVERQDDSLVREVRSRWLIFRERVTIDKAKREIRYTMQEHPHFFGAAVLRAVPLSRQSPVLPVRLTMTVDWAPKTEEGERIVIETMPAEIQQEVEGIKEEAEARDAE